MRLFPIGLFAPAEADPPAFSPADIANMLWLDANDLALGNGAAVALWTDGSSAGNTVTQATANAKPTYASAGAPGGAAVTFDGGDFLTRTNGAETIGSGDLYFHFVVKLPASIVGGEYTCLFAAFDSPNTDTSFLGIYVLDGVLTIECDVGFTDLVFDSALSAGTWYQIEIIFSGGVWGAAIGGVAEPTTHTASYQPPPGAEVLDIGGDGASAPADSWAGSIASVVIRNGSVTNQQRTDMRAYATAHYGI